jgi:alpha-1,6-mannosyltransferase
MGDVTRAGAFRAVRLPLVLCAVATIASAAVLAVVPDLRTTIVVFLAAWTIIGGCMLAAFRWWNRWVTHEKRAVSFVLGVALLARFMLSWSVPSLSDDLWRYAWDGHVMASGHNPYAYAPGHPKLQPLRNEAYTHVPYLQHHSIYPPLVEIILGGCAWVSNVFFDGSARATMRMWRILLVLVEAGTLFALVGLLRARGRSMRWLVLYAWHPLAMIEFGREGHSDALMVAGIAIMLASLAVSKPGSAMMAYAAAVAARGIPLLYAPVLLRAMHWKRMLLAVLLVVLVVVPFASSEALAGVLSSVGSMGSVFVFNACGFWVIYSICEALRWWPAEPHITVSLAALFAGVVTVIVVRNRDGTVEGVARTMLAICSAAALLLWNMHPWYFTWGLVLVPLVGSRAWLWLTLIAGFTYLHYAPGGEPWFVAAGIAEYAGFAGLLVWGMKNEE